MRNNQGRAKRIKESFISPSLYFSIIKDHLYTIYNTEEFLIDQRLLSLAEFIALDK